MSVSPGCQCKRPKLTGEYSPFAAHFRCECKGWVSESRIIDENIKLPRQTPPTDFVPRNNFGRR